MRVLFLTHNFPRSTGDPPGSFILRLARALASEGVSVRVVAPAGAGAADQDAVEGVTVDRFRYAPRRFETLAYGGNMAALVRESWSARVTLLGFLGAEFRCAVRVARAFEPQLIHAHWWFPSGLVGTWTRRIASVPLVTTLHGTDVRLARSVAMARPAFRHVLGASAKVTTVSHWLADETRALVPSAKPVVAPMPVAAELFTPEGDRGDRVLFVGRLNRQKGIELFLRALARTSTPVDADVVGDTSTDHGQRMVALAGQLGIAERIRWHAPVAQPRLVDFYRRAAMLVVPSIDEGLGLTPAEAQLCETPVIALASGGLTDVVQDGRTGLLVQSPEPDALAAAIDAMLARPDRGRSLGAAGRIHATAAFAPESAARRYADLYRAVIAS